MAEVKDYSAEALLAKEKEVDLDTDNVKEENVEVKEEATKEKEPNLNVGEVDLGYTGHEKTSDEKKDEPKIEITEDVKEEVIEEKKVESQSEEKPNLNESRRDYQKRIDKLVFQKKEAERREKAALEYAKSVEQRRKELESRFKKTDSEYVKKFETSISTGLEAAQKELAAAIESGDATAQVEANKRIATLAFENAKLEQAKAGREEKQAEKPVTLSEPPVQRQQMDDPINPDPKAEAWASENSWFGTDRAMTFTAFEIHKDLVEKEGYDPNRRVLC